MLVDTIPISSMILGETISFTRFVVYFGFGLFGLFGSLLFDAYDGVKNGTLGKDWLKINVFRILVSIFVIMCGVLFGEELVGLKLSNWSSFLAGFTSDNIINKLLIKKKGGENKEL